MAKTTKEKPTTGSQTEKPIEGNPPGGVSFQDLIRFTTGSQNPSADEFESVMAARGYKSSDVRKLKRAFNKIQDGGSEYYLRDKGFDVYDDGQRQSGSGQAKGNKMGLDLGDLVGLGNDVSLLAGALRRELPDYNRAENAAVEQIGKDVESGVQQALATADTGTTPESVMTDKMNSLTNPGSKGGKKGAGKGAGAKGAGQPKDNFKSGDIFQPDWDLLNWSPLKNSGSASQQTTQQPAQTMEGGQSEGGVQRGSALNSMQDFEYFWKTNPGYATSEIGRNMKDAASTGMFTLPLVGSLFKQGSVGSKAANRFLLPAALGGLGLEVVGDAFDPDKDVDWAQAGADAGEIALMGLLNKYNANKPQGLPNVASRAGQAAQGANKITKFTQNAGKKAAQTAGKRMANKVQFPKVQNLADEATEADFAQMRDAYLQQSYKNAPFPYQSPLPFEEGGKLPRRRVITKFSY